MSLGHFTDRLRSVVQRSPLPVAPLSSAPDDVGREPTDLEEHDVEAVLGGEWQARSGGQCFVVERRDGPHTQHGPVQLGTLAEALERVVGNAPLLANGAAARPPFVFFDLETTGLSGGAGTYAFLVGCGWFDEAGGFVTRQHILVRQVDERPMLQAVADEIGKAGALVSFNGKSFDAPLLESRFLYHRLPWTGGRLPHVDVLHPARRFWRPEAAIGGQASCSLGFLERYVLGADRTDDVLGIEAPARYFRFIRSGDPRPLVGVIEHNRLDLLSLAGLTIRLLRLVNDGPAEARDAREALAVGRLYERAGLPGRAADAYAHALGFEIAEGRASSALVRVDALRGLAQLARRARRYHDAAARWREVLEQPGCPDGLAREAAEALAIHHEHRVRDLRSARDFALRTFDVEARVSRTNAVRHRLARLDRKLEAVARAPRLQLED
jgi:uncharacterized protein